MTNPKQSNLPASVARRLAEYIQKSYVPGNVEASSSNNIDQNKNTGEYYNTPGFPAPLKSLFIAVCCGGIILDESHLKKTFSELVIELLKKKQIKASDMYHKAGITKDHFSKIKNTKDYQPSKATALAMVLAMQLKLSEAEDLLERAGYTFSPSQMRDLVVKFFIEEGIYDVDEVNIQLHERGLPPLTSNKNS